MGLRNLAVWKSFAREALHRSMIVAKFLCSLHVINTYICTPVFCYGPSMLPTINLTGDLLLADKISHRIGKVGPGDIIVVRSPVKPRSVITKRVKGVEGDSITYLVDPENTDTSTTIVVPKGHIWVEGDNIYKSKDSRMFGAVPYGLVHAKVFWRVWPFKDFGPLLQKNK